MIEDYVTYPIIKTHMLPSRLPKHLQNVPSVCLIRDARDSLISITHQRKRFNRTEGSFHKFLLQAILAQDGTFFGGWATNINQWSTKSSIIIYFEDLIKNPIEEIEKLRSLIDLPIPEIERLPTFETLKSGKCKYPSGNNKTNEQRIKNAKSFFRKGKIGGWKEEFTFLAYILFINLHGDTMEKMNYDLYPEGFEKYRKYKNPFMKMILPRFVQFLMILKLV